MFGVVINACYYGIGARVWSECLHFSLSGVPGSNPGKKHIFSVFILRVGGHLTSLGGLKIGLCTFLSESQKR